MKKGMKLLSLMLALSLLFALAACGTTGTGDEPSTEAAQSSSPVAPGRYAQRGGVEGAYRHRHGETDEGR